MLRGGARTQSIAFISVGKVHRGYVFQVPGDGLQPHYSTMATEGRRRELLLYGLQRQNRDEEPRHHSCVFRRMYAYLS